MIFQGTMTTGDLISYMLFALQSVFAFQALLSIFPKFMEAIGASVRVFELLDRQPLVNYDGGMIPPRGIEGRITFKNVGFHYPSRPEIEVLQGVTMDLVPGKTLALVGPSGAGKSTFIALISRFYDVQKGVILIDAVDIQTYDPQWLRGQIGLVSQEPVLFACSIEENIVYGSENANRSQVERAAKMANAHDFILRIPDGYKAQVGERGVMLSGGQKQRVAIARALLKDPTILLLDEATSALDSENEKLVQDALDRLMVGRTCVVIAHRLSTIQDADVICVVAGGKIVEQGTHEELVKVDGVYKKLGKRQFGEKAEKEKRKNETDDKDVHPREKMGTNELLERILKHRKRPGGFQHLMTQCARLTTEPEAVKHMAKELFSLEAQMQERIDDLTRMAVSASSAKAE